MATKTKGKKKEHIMVNVMLLDFHVSSFFVHSFDPKKKRKERTHYANWKKKKKKKTCKINEWTYAIMYKYP